MEVEPVPNALNAFGNLFLMLGCFAKPYYKERSLILPQLDISCFVGTHRRPAHFGINMDEGWIGEEMQRGSRGEGMVGGGGEAGGGM